MESPNLLGLGQDPEDTEDAAAGPQLTPPKGRLSAKQGSAEDVAQQARRDGIDAAHFLGLAALYADRGEYAAAFDCIEICRQKAPTLPYAYKLHGRLLLRLGRFNDAAAQFYRALRYNPFDREVSDCLGQLEYERKNFVESLAATVDAFLLLADENTETASRLRRRVRTLKRHLCWDNETLLTAFQERQTQLTTAFDRLQWRRDLFLREQGSLGNTGSLAGQDDVADRRAEREPSVSENSASYGDEPDPPAATLADRLRPSSPWSRLAQPFFDQLSSATSEQCHDAGALIFDADPEAVDFFFLEHGQVALSRHTTHGDLRLTELGPGELFGEAGWVDGLGWTERARALDRCRVLRIDGRALEQIIAREPHWGVELLAGLWQVLAARLRQSNNRLDDFFPGDRGSGIARRLSVARGKVDGGDGLAIGTQDKIRLFREQGLTRSDLLTLASYARERRYPAESYLFRQDDPGTAMFFVLDGKVRISKFIAGAGEEALAILSRGEFFGEMSLVDGQPRSADARCHRGPVTVLELDRPTINDALRLDARSAMVFQRLMCRILASRVREIGDKIILWQILDRHE